MLVLAGLVWCTATSAHLGGATVATCVRIAHVSPTSKMKVKVLVTHGAMWRVFGIVS